jgi:endonuclease/exonuclease/phosphatase family metal-dependent hydrolase
MKLKYSCTLLTFIVALSICSQNKTKEPTIVKVLSFNILHGATMKGDFDLDVLAKVIKDTDPDLVAMQEVDYQTNRAKKYDLMTELGWRTKMASLFGRAMPYDGGEYGEGVLSKTTFLSSRNVVLPHSKGNEPRVALEVVTVLKSGDTIAFIGTHLDHLPEVKDRNSQAKKINKVFSSNRYPTIVAGDLNATPGSEAIDILESVWQFSYDPNNIEPTFPSNNPRKKIDYVMTYPKKRWKVLKTQVIQDTLATDHCVYLVTLELRDK